MRGTSGKSYKYRCKVLGRSLMLSMRARKMDEDGDVDPEIAFRLGNVGKMCDLT